VPPIPGLKESRPLDNVAAMRLSAVPKRVVVIGAGVIGMEFASFFAEVGSQVTVVELLPNALVQVDPELTRVALRVLERKGVRVVTNAKISEVSADGKKRAVKGRSTARHKPSRPTRSSSRPGGDRCWMR
jgi:dihydrolipoamide dehydrogenase